MTYKKSGFRIVRTADLSGDVGVPHVAAVSAMLKSKPLAEAPGRAPRYLVTFGG